MCFVAWLDQENVEILGKKKEKKNWIQRIAYPFDFLLKKKRDREGWGYSYQSQVKICIIS